MFRKLYVAGFLIFSLTYVSCKKDVPSSGGNPPPEDPLQTVFLDNDNLLMGNPSNATHANENNYLLKRDAYTVSYSRARAIPNWVSWHLSSTDLGAAPRQDLFIPDLSLPPDWYHVSDLSYSGSGFDRGHNCPSADRTSTTVLNLSTFYMTNIIPQAPELNQGPWAEFEDYIRSYVTTGNEAYIIMGNYNIGGTGANNIYAQTIDHGRVTVPAVIWKVVVILPNGNNDTSRVNATTRVIAVKMDNVNISNVNWKTKRTSVDEIERISGIDLLSRLPVAVQNTIEAKVDNK